MEEASEVFASKFEDHSNYLSPEWTFAQLAEDTEDPAEIGHDILSLVSNELSSYISSHVQFRHEALQECGISSENGEAWLSLDSAQQDILQSHADVNFKYCQQLLKYLISTHVEESGAALTLANVSDVFIEYMDYAPGPWREAAFVDVLIRNIIPRLIEEEALRMSTIHSSSGSGSAPGTPYSWEKTERHTPGTEDTRDQSISTPAGQSPQPDFVSTSTSKLFERKEVDTTTKAGDKQHGSGDNASASGNASVEESDHDLGSKASGSLTDGFDLFDDEFSETTSLMGGSLNNLNLTRSDQQKLANKLKRAVHTINRLKTESAMLKDSLQAAKASDMTLLQDKWRGAQADLTTIRRRNTELKDRVQVLEASLFDALNPQKDTKRADSELNEFGERKHYGSKGIPGKPGALDRSPDTVMLSDFGDDEGDDFHEANSSSTSNTSATNKLAHGLLHQRLEHRAKAIAVAAQSRKQRITPATKTADAQIYVQLQEQVAQTTQLQKLVSVYESRLSTMQAAIDRYANTSANSVNPEKKSDADADTELLAYGGASLAQLLTALPAAVSREHRKYIERAAAEQIQIAKEVDRRTIDSLIKENDRITALLPAGFVDTPADADVVAAGTSETSDKAGTGATQDGKKAASSTTAVGLRAAVASETRRRTLEDAAAAHTFGPSALLMSCLVGFLLTLMTPWLKTLFRH